MDDPVKARDLFASGQSHVLWGTLDMMALFAPELVKDSRTVPVICQQIDWSVRRRRRRGARRHPLDQRLPDEGRQAQEGRARPELAQPLLHHVAAHRRRH